MTYRHPKQAQAGTRADLGIYVRSKWEANWARYLRWLKSIGEISDWAYEPEEFQFPVKRGNRFYTPDFKITNKDGSIEYHEIKGYMDKDSRTKLKRMLKYYPHITVKLIEKDSYYAVARKAKYFVPHWE
jgi:hypothetical protein